MTHQTNDNHLNGNSYPKGMESNGSAAHVPDGKNEPLLLQDFHLVDLLSHFDRERIAKRVVHAKGAGAHGYYTTTDFLEDLCLAGIFKQGKACPITVRFSTFRTDEGNWDVVANNTPVFFLIGPAKFSHFIHTQKRHPSTHLTHADDSPNFWHYASKNPESVHQFMILFGNRDIPDGKGEWVYMQLHFKSKQSTGFITQQDSANYSPDYSTNDYLYQAIEKGDHPGWDKINVFDLTHVWPQDQFKLRKIGEFFLNENPKNYFAEVEQVAFHPAHLVPSIEPSADPHDGQMAFHSQGSRPNYLSSIQLIQFKKRSVELNKVDNNFQGDAITFLPEIKPGDFNAPRKLWEKVFDDGAEERFIKNISGHMATCAYEEIIKRVICIFRGVSDDIATRLEKATGEKGYDSISNLQFNGSFSRMTKDETKAAANGKEKKFHERNGAPTKA
ncbi:heme-dependent catalase [Macroventuria anomochaeta]|uniref:Heme-dependent catalase n=1 Tax=Macroventuria anomochaeta TaxID=301207 RepID=A0ACB6SC08_9PLEO|nr:heme-dependent catalase [Macroventuria anomochaeta]KAF2631517.1 heme-dependent catalase [Macroventuria anomochaeta]